MFIFGHAGVSSLAAYLMKRRIHNIDYRYVALGSMLSDIIDKPLGLIILKDVLYNGRLIGHTLLFAFALTIISFTKKSMKLKMLSLELDDIARSEEKTGLPAHQEKKVPSTVPLYSLVFGSLG